MISSTCVDIIKPEQAEAKKTELKTRIERELRRASAYDVIAANLDKAYITKAVIPKVLALLPDVKHAYVKEATKQSYWLELSYSNVDYNNRDSLWVCNNDTRRMDAAWMHKHADECRKTAARFSWMLAQYDTMIERYNRIAREYAEIAVYLTSIFDIPDYAYIPYVNRDTMTP